MYQTVYTEDTQNSEVGYIFYDKDLDVQTGNKVSGQYNVKAVKQITYLGVDASSVVTNDYLMLDGVGWPDNAGRHMICRFSSSIAYGSFCNKVETGSAMNERERGVEEPLYPPEGRIGLEQAPEEGIFDE